MTHHAKLHARAIAAIPDTPVTVETRALALDPATYVHAIGAGWLLIAGSAERARIFTAGTDASPPRPFGTPFGAGPVIVRRLSPRDELAHLPSRLRGELDKARATRDVHAAWKDGLPVSFAYVSHETERHGDLSIDTLEAFRRRGLALAALRPVLAALLSRGKVPVWGAIESNTASLTLARALGLTQHAGTLWVATRAG